MKKYSKTVRCDARGQLVIPKELRKELNISDGTAFWAFLLENEGILLKRIRDETLDYHDRLVIDINSRSVKIGIDKKNISKSIERYRKNSKGGLEEI